VDTTTGCISFFKQSRVKIRSTNFRFLATGTTEGTKMNPKMQQAIVAARTGQNKEAQILLTQVLKEDPEEVQAWFLLSHLVESEQKQLTYLKRVLALDPHHEKAAQQLAQLESAEEPATVSSPIAEFEAEAAVDEIPDELVVAMEEPVEEMVIPAPLTPEPADTLMEILDFESMQGVMEEAAEPTAPAAVAEPTPAIVPPLAEPSPAQTIQLRDEQARMTRVLLGLSVAATIVFIALVYLIFTSL
jgi:hypothetical protein